VRTRTLVLQTPNTKRSPLELNFKGRLVPSGVASCEDPSIPAKNRGESSEDTRIVRFIWAQKGEWCWTRTTSGQASRSHMHTLKDYSRKTHRYKRHFKARKVGIPPSRSPREINIKEFFKVSDTERESRHISTSPLEFDRRLLTLCPGIQTVFLAGWHTSKLHIGDKVFGDTI